MSPDLRDRLFRIRGIRMPGVCRALSGAVLITVGAAQDNTLHLDEVMRRVMVNSPELTGLEAYLREQSAVADQARRWSNPVLTLEKENFAGSRAYRGSALAEYTATLDQTIEVGGKRGLRVDLARLGQRQAELKLAVKRTALAAEVRRRFVMLQLAQGQWRNATERLETTHAAAEVVSAKRGAGVSGGPEGARTQVSVSLAEVELARAASQLDRAREQLARLWDGTGTEVAGVVETLLLVAPPPGDEAAWLRRLQDGPRWQLTENWRATQGRHVALAGARVWPDLTLKIGRRWFEQGDDHAWVAGVALPLPVFDRNRASLRVAREGLTRVEAEAAEERRMLREHLTVGLAQVKAAHAAAERLQRETLPLARRSYALVEEGYRLGRYELLFLLEAQQTLYAVEAGVLDALGELHLALIDLDDVLGVPEPTPPTPHPGLP